jgi:hypothetical protein
MAWELIYFKPWIISCCTSFGHYEQNCYKHLCTGFCAHLSFQVKECDLDHIYGKEVFNFVWHCQTVFQGDDTTWHAHQQRVRVPVASTALDDVSVLDFGISNRCVLVSHRFNLHRFNLWNIFSFAYFPFAYFLWEGVCLQLLPIFN